MSEWALPQIDFERCTLCGSCVSACSAGALELGAQGPHFAAPQNCTYCAECEALCPTGAITCTFTITWGDPG
jgi:formate hydrogenlyase subunit 6/NADH:ubiquinone oxidoreductase subunit I